MSITETLKRWFLKERRDLPWRVDPTPYRVWISEIMLQQTRADVVIPYFLRWMEAFPSIEALAKAPIEQVIKQWEGLGYYSRARNIHATAKALSGELPSEYNALLSLKGIGTYTAGAILSFAFGQKYPAIDGNVMRVITRLFAITGDIAKKEVQREIEERVWSLLPDQEPELVMEGLIELGALVCKKAPLCGKCPLRLTCQGRAIVDTLPRKKKASPIEKLVRTVAVIESPTGFLLRQGEQGRVMADLWEFPYRELPYDWQKFSPHLTSGIPLPTCTHSFTRYAVTLHPLYFSLPTPIELPGHKSVPRHHVTNLPFSSGHKRVLEIVLGKYE